MSRDSRPVTNTPDLTLKNAEQWPSGHSLKQLKFLSSVYPRKYQGSLHFRREREVAKQWTQRVRFIARCSRNGTDVSRRLLLLLLHRPGRGAAKQRGQQKSAKGGQSLARLFRGAVPQIYVASELLSFRFLSCCRRRQFLKPHLEKQKRMRSVAAHPRA